MVACLVSAGASLERADTMGRTPLLRAAAAARHQCALLLLEQGADVEARDGQGLGALHLAALSGSWPLCEILLKHGVDVDTVRACKNKTREAQCRLMC